MILAIPSDNPGGLEAGMSAHFGHCDLYTMVTVDDKTIRSVSLLENPPHVEGGCLASVQNLAGKGIDALLAGGMGMRPLNGFRQAGIEVLFAGNCPTVGQAVQAFLDGKLQAFSPEATCKGH